MLTRKQWIGSGIAGAAALAIAGLTAESLETDRDVLAAIVPVMLEGVQDADAGATIDGFGVAVAGLTPSVQGEVAQLFALLRIAPLRIAATGIIGPWSRVAPERVAQFLTDWRYSRIPKLRSAYDALHQLVFAAWYGNPRSWPAIGYPGPPTL